MENNLEDRISMLPDDILVVIISRLKLSEAASTSVLSHRWRYLWKYTTGSLDFVKSVLSCDAIHSHWDQNSVEASPRKFIEWVNYVLKMHKGSMIDEFRVCFNLGEGSSNVIDSWIIFALKRHVKRLMLDFGHVGDPTPEPSYGLRTQVFSSYSLGSLTSLHLKRVEVTGEVLGCILSKFPLLQELCVKLSFSLVELKIAGPLPNLRCLQIKHCPSLRCLDIHAINLVSFAYRGPKIGVLFKEVPHLIEADLDQIFLDKNICHFSSYFTRLESLVLDLKDWIFPLRMKPKDFLKFPKFKKLKQLVLSLSGFDVDDYLLCCMKLLKASPSLQRFVLKIYDDMEEEDEYYGSSVIRKRKVKYQHKQLKVVEVVGYLGNMKCFNLVRRLLANLPSMEKLFVDPRPFKSIYGRETMGFG